MHHYQYLNVGKQLRYNFTIYKITKLLQQRYLFCSTVDAEKHQLNFINLIQVF